MSWPSPAMLARYAVVSLLEADAPCRRRIATPIDALVARAASLWYLRTDDPAGAVRAAVAKLAESGMITLEPDDCVRLTGPRLVLVK